MVPIDQPLPEIEARLTMYEYLARIEYLTRRLAILDAKLDIIGHRLENLMYSCALSDMSE